MLFSSQVLRELFSPRGRFWLGWGAVLVGVVVSCFSAWLWARRPSRRDGNWGHTSIDFCGQWVLAHLVVTGRGRQLYDRTTLRSALDRALPREDEMPDQNTSDVADLLDSMVGFDDPWAPGVAASFLTPLAARNPWELTALVAGGQSIWTPDQIRPLIAPRLGGPLYPPVQSVLFAPLGLLTPRAAYRLMQGLTLGLMLLAGWLIARLSRGRIDWPVATVAAMLVPGYTGALNMGQNPAFSLVLLLGGWLLMNRGRPWLGGVLWGFLAFKPVWAVAFGPVLLLTGRWRAALGMGFTGLALVALTLPVVGPAAWFDWLAVGKLAAAIYDSDENWIFLSRDLFGLPRRYLLTFKDKTAINPDRPLVAELGWGLWGMTLAVTVAISLFRRRQVTGGEGIGPAFVLLGAWLSCYHFMYYDTLLAVLPLAVLWDYPERLLPGEGSWWRRGLRSVPFWGLVLLIVLGYLGPLLDPHWQFPPFDTFLLWGLWGWCGFQVIRAGPDPPA
jgi:hypothetical protein